MADISLLSFWTLECDLPLVPSFLYYIQNFTLPYLP